MIILNDDCQDNTVTIVEKLMKSDTELDISIIHRTNGGYGLTVNRGIEENKGKYFKIIDGDDWINPKQFESYLKQVCEC